MFTNREALMQQARVIDPSHASDSRGRAFLEHEERAAVYTEYITDAIPTFAQTPEMTKLYMHTYGAYSEEGIALGIKAREVRAREATHRTNVLFVTEQALNMEAVIADDGTLLPLKTPPEVRDKQLKHLSAFAVQPYIDLRLVRRNAALPDLGTTILFEFTDHTRSVFAERDGGIQGPIDAPEEIESYLVGLDRLHAIAMSNEETRAFLAELG